MANRPQFYGQPEPVPGAYNEFGAQPGQRLPPGGAAAGPSPFNDILYGAGSNVMTRGLAAYSEKVQTNVQKYFAGQNLQYYFSVNEPYVRNKLKVLLFPWLHRGHWTRIAEQVAGGLSYKTPRNDINAPDLYIPVMAFGTYMILCGICMGMGGRFGPEVLGSCFTKALLGWAAETLLLRSILYTLSSNDAALLDLVAYAGYFFVGVCINILAWLLWRWAYYGVLVFTGLNMSVFLVKTMKRILFAEARSYDRDSSRHHYMLLLVALLQFPLALWLGAV